MALADFRADGTRQEYDLRDDAPGLHPIVVPTLGGTTFYCRSDTSGHWMCPATPLGCACACHTPTAAALPSIVPAQRTEESARAHA